VAFRHAETTKKEAAKGEEGVKEEEQAEKEVKAGPCTDLKGCFLFFTLYCS